MHPTEIAAQFAAAEAAIAAGEPARGEAHLAQCLRAEPAGFLEPYCRFALEQGWPDKAAAALSRRLAAGDHALVIATIDGLLAESPGDAMLREQRVDALHRAGRLQEALDASLGLPDFRLLTIANVLAAMERVDATDQLEAELCRILRSPAFFPERLGRVLVDVLRQKIAGWQNTPDVLALIANDAYCHAVLRHFDLTMADLEAFLTNLRREMLAQAIGEETLVAGGRGLMLSLAAQARANEFVYCVSDKEREHLGGLDSQLRRSMTSRDPLRAVRLALAGLMYRPAWSADWPVDLRDLDFRTVYPPAADIIERWAEEYAEESALARSFAAGAELRDEISRRVGHMYEINPYPRWRGQVPSINPGRKSFIEYAGLDRTPGWIGSGEARMDRTLVAGCGTGMSAVSLAANFPEMRVTGIDISARSLAYAALMARRLGVRNVDFERRDILCIADRAERFDLVEAGGVLHHMRDPGRGLQALVTCLRPGGVVKLGLYSAAARRAISRFRETRGAGSAPVTPHRIRAVRQAILTAGPEGEFAEFLRLRDFYSMSGCRDLLFHEHEELFTVDGLDALLRSGGLTFLKFTNVPGGEDRLRSLLGAQADPHRLASWKIAEALEPQLFAGMYVFYAQRAG